MSIPTDEEKWIPSTVPKLVTARPMMGGTLRKRRLLATGSMVLAFMVLGSRYCYSGELPCVGGFWKNTGDSMFNNLISR
jgi:hypothetical protein